MLIDFRSLQPGVFVIWGRGIFTALLMAFYSVEDPVLSPGWYIQMPDEVPVMTRRGFQPDAAAVHHAFAEPAAAWLQQQFGITCLDFMAALFRPPDRVPTPCQPLLITSCRDCPSALVHDPRSPIVTLGRCVTLLMAGVSANRAALMAGEPLPHTSCKGSGTTSISIGGLGSLALVFMAMCAAAATPSSRRALVHPPCSTSTSCCCSVFPSS